MICPTCQAANPKTARFCMNCGSSLALVTPLAPLTTCPSCGSALLPGAKFCHNCGYSLAVGPNPALQDRVQQYIPRELLLKLQAARSVRIMEGERRIVTMLFCDVKGSTAMAEKLDPEEWAEIMNGAFEYLIPPVFRYEGTIPRLLGDAILAFFGAPIAHEDDPERAVRAGLEIVAGVREYRERIQQERGLDFDVRVGINTGLVVTGEMGTDMRLEYTAMGDAINLAARMEQTARPGTVQITGHTYRLVAPIFEVEPLGEIEIKGKSEPVETYRVLGLKASPRRTHRSPGEQALWFGRDQELAALSDRLAEVRQGRGGIICLIGEAGVGKSRLIAELQRSWGTDFPPGQAVAWDIVNSASFAAARPYGALRQHLREHMGIREDDPPEAVRAKIDRMYENEVAALRERAVRLYSLLLGIDAPRGAAPLPDEEGAFKRELYDLILSFERIWLGGRPGIQVFDDLQWTDPLSADLLVHLLRLARELPILYICAFRPDPGIPAWSVRQAAATEYQERYTEIRLLPLPAQAARALIQQSLPGSSAHPELVEKILEKAEGNPLFIEEVVAELASRDILNQNPEGPGLDKKSGPFEITIPNSLQGLLTARLDQLKEDTRRTLQLASVLGRSFYYTVLRQVIETPIQLDQELQELQQIDLIREVARQPELEFQFRHALVQEAAYGSILVRRRREFHRRVAEALKTVFSDRLEDYADLLAHHFDAAGDSQARQYYRLAGKKAAQLYANQDALAYYSRALEISDGTSPEETMMIHAGRGEIYFLSGHFEQASADFESAIDLARQAGCTSDENRLLATLAWLRWSSGRGAEALELAREAEKQSMASGEPSQALYASIVLGTALQNIGDLSGARTRMRRALFASRRQGGRPGMLRMAAMSLHYLAMLENFAGRFGRAVACAQKAYDLYLRLENRMMACGALLYQSLAEGGRGRYDSALAVLEEGRRQAEEISSPWLARYPNQRAWLSAELGDWEAAYQIDLTGLRPAQALPGFREVEISTLINLALDCTALGRLAEAGAYLAESQKDLGRPEFGSHNWRWSIRLADAGARLELARGDLAAASQSVASLLDQAGQREARKYKARGLVLRGQVRMAQGSLNDAEADLQAARRLADSLCYFPTRVEARLHLSRLYHQTGNEEYAWQHDAEVRGLVETMGAQLRNPELQASFERGIGNTSHRK